jgi:FtsP/CotA-like multicopper oxidase with cupredoxin domain
MDTIQKVRRNAHGLCLIAGLLLNVGSAYAGDGWGDFTLPDGVNQKVPTFYANSPSGPLSNAACFDATGTAATGCDTGKAIQKFVDALPPMAYPGGFSLKDGTTSVKTAAGKYIPVAVPTTWIGNGTDDYYEIAVVEWKERFHSDLANPTTIRGYVQIDPNATGSGVTTSPHSLAVALTDIYGAPILLPNGSQAYAYDAPHYLGAAITSTQNKPTRIKFYNLLPVGRAAAGKRNGDIFLPVDETLPGAGFGPDGAVKFTQNRSELHLHGGDNPWISDGTPHQWIAPAGEATAANGVAAEAAAKGLTPAQAAKYLRGVSAVNVPDMPDPGPGAMTYYYPNGESARLMWFHDHTFGLTRLNVYAGEAALYTLKDAAETAAIAAGKLPADEIPLVIQDKTFVPKNITIQDAKWDTALWGGESDLWYPHVYEVNQDPGSIDLTNGVGRWDWGPYFWPVFPSYYDRLPDGSHNMSSQTIDGLAAPTGLTEVTTTPEAFVDTPLVNGQAYPTMTVEPKAYRVKMLNAMNDRMVNLGLYIAADKVTTNPLDPLDPTTQPTVCDGVSKRGDGTTPSRTDCTEMKMVNFDTSYPNLYYPTLPTAPYGVNGQFSFPTTGGPNDSGWGPSGAGGGFMAINSGVPDPATIGPDIHMIGNEAGLLAKLHTIPSNIVNFENNKRSITILNVLEKGLFLGPAMRADTVIDFSQYAGKTLILYNDAPAPLPAGDPRIDYYTGMGDYSTVGGIENVLPGYGPNDRTIMQIVVAPARTDGQAITALDTVALAAEVPALHGATQPMPVIAQPRYADAFPAVANAAETIARINTGAIYLGKYNGLTFKTPEAITYTAVPQVAGKACTTPANCAANLQVGQANAAAGATVTAYVESKAIQELFEPTYGRMNATLGVELPFTSSLTQTTIPLGYVDPVTEKIADGETQFWKITHNGVDAHPVHFHLVNVQVINRVGWDGTLKLPTDAEIGWKETVVMNPLEDIIVAVRAKAPRLPFGLPNSVRARDPSQPTGATVTAGFTQVNPANGNPAVVFNKEEDYGWEYVWHCHILGHEENDFMRPFVFNYWDDKLFQKNADGSFLKVAGNRVAIPSLAAVIPASLTDLTANGNVLTWSDPTPITQRTTLGNPRNEIGYHIVRTAPDGTITKFEAVANATSFTDASLGAVSAAAYQYTVTPWNQMGAATILNPGGVINTNGGSNNNGLALSATGVAAVATDTTAAVTWTNPNTGTTTSVVTVTTVANAMITVNGGTNSATITGLTPNTAYTFGVVLTGTNGTPAAPATATVTTDAAAATAVTNGVVTANSAAFTWTNINPGNTTTALSVTPNVGVIITRNGNTGATLTGLTANTAYTLSVVVTGSNGNVSAPSTGSATTNALSVTGVAVSAVTSNSANLAWLNPVTGGTPTVSVLPASANIVVTSTGATTASVTGLTQGTNYTFTVINTGTNGVAVPSATVAARTPALLTPATNVAATMVANNQLVLAWTDNAIGETGYQVQMQVQGNNNAPWVTLTTIAGVAGNGSTASTTVTPVPAMRNNRVYNFRLIAVDSTRVGTASVVATINLNNTPNSPVIGTATAGVGSATVTWALASNNSATVQVQSRTTFVLGNSTFQGQWVTIAILPGNSISYTGTGLLRNNLVQYRVRAANQNGSSNWSAATANVTVQ